MQHKQAVEPCCGTWEGMMKTYAGIRTIDGLQVTVDGKPLDSRQDVHAFSDAGFEWGYTGDAPKQLALAILCDCLGDVDAALTATDDFMKNVVSVLDNEWTLSAEEIESALGKSASR